MDRADTPEHFHVSQNPFATPPFATPIPSIRSIRSRRPASSAVSEVQGTRLLLHRESVANYTTRTSTNSSSTPLQELTVDWRVRSNLHFVSRRGLRDHLGLKSPGFKLANESQTGTALFSIHASRSLWVSALSCEKASLFHW
jgi:hypothetical protein